MILAALHSLEFEIAGLEKHFRIARQLSPSRNIPFNFCVLALRVGLLAETRREADALLSRYPDDVDVLSIVEDVACGCCDFEMLFEVRGRLERLGKPFKGIDHKKFLPVMDRAKAMGISVDQIVARLETAASVLREANEPIFGHMFDITPEGTFAYSFGVDANVAELTEYSLSMADVLVEKFEDPLADLITISCLRRRELPARELSHASAEAGA